MAIREDGQADDGKELRETSSPVLIRDRLLPSDFFETSDYTFTQIIDADHFTIQRIAASIRKVITSTPLLTLPSSTPINTLSKDIQILLTRLKPLLLEITWRLIRHDLSEDVVMRPAFASILGKKGEEMAEHDRRDHTSGRQDLIKILEMVEALELSLRAGSKQPSEPLLNEALTKLRRLVSSIIGTFDDLGKHMAVESGGFLPYFETIVGSANSKRLAREYVLTLFVTPYLVLLGPSGDASEGAEQAVFKSAEDYVMTPPSELHKVYERLLEAAKPDRRAAGLLKAQIQKEIERLQVGKWLGVNERTALRTAGNTQAVKLDKL